MTDAAKRILLIDHKGSARDDRASAHLRGRGHETLWLRPGEGEALPDPGDYDAVIVYGGMEMLSTDLDDPEKAYLRDEVDFVGRWIGAGKPMLGICLGGQIMAKALGAAVWSRDDRLHQVGYYEIAPTAQAGGFLTAPMWVYHWHREGFDLPAGAEHLASHPDFPAQAIRYGKAFGLQFHPEVDRRIALRWWNATENPGAAKGAQGRDEQQDLGARHDAAVESWFKAFLDRWLAGEA